MPLVSSYLSLSCKHRPPLASWVEDSETMHDSTPHQAPLEADQWFKPNTNTTNTTTNKKRSTARNCSKLDCPNTVLLSHKGSKHCEHCEKCHDVMMSWCRCMTHCSAHSAHSAQRSPEKCQDEGPTLSWKISKDIVTSGWSREAVKPWRDWSCWMFWESQQADSSGMYDEASNSGSFLPCDATMLYPNLSCFLDLKCDNETSEKGYGKYFACHVARNLAKGTSVVRFPWPSKICNRTIATQRGAGTDSSGIHILCKNYTKLLTRLTICS